MVYDYLKVRYYNEREEEDLDGNYYYVLSFDNAKHLKVSKIAKMIIEQFNGERNLDDIINVLEDKGINIGSNDLIKFIEDILINKDMLDNGCSSDNKTKRKSKLWVHIPIIHSSRFNLVYKGTKVLFNKYIFGILMALVLCIEGYTICNCFIMNKINYDEINSLIILLIAYSSLFIHEIGHVTAAYKFDVESGKFGIGMYLIYLVFYVDMTNIWRLNKNQRVLIDMAGMYFQLICIIPIFLIYLLTGNPTYMMATIFILGMTFTNLMPFLKLDGYWMLNDYLNIQNVDVKAFKSIKSLFLQLYNKFKNRHSDYNIKISKSCLVYGIYSSIYMLVTTIMICYMIFISVDLILNYNNIKYKINVIIQNIFIGEYNKALVNMNNIIIMVIPLIVFLYMVVSIIISILKSVIYRTKNKEGKKISGDF